MSYSLSNDDIIRALEKNHGMIYLAAKELGCAPKTIYRRADKVKAVRDTIDNQRGKMIDTAELKLEQAILAGEQWAINLALKTIGKHRGYVERQEVTGADGGSIQFDIASWKAEREKRLKSSGELDEIDCANPNA